VKGLKLQTDSNRYFILLPFFDPSEPLPGLLMVFVIVRSPKPAAPGAVTVQLGTRTWYDLPFTMIVLACVALRQAVQCLPKHGRDHGA
jgi:hypothetical protein